MSMRLITKRFFMKCSALNPKKNGNRLYFLSNREVIEYSSHQDTVD